MTRKKPAARGKQQGTTATHQIERQEIPAPHCGRTHVVILGAGASLAAFPNGDRHRRKLPLMWNLIDVVGLDDLLDDAGITENRDNFEKLYSDLVTTGQHRALVEELDLAIFNFFADMELPDKPTLYDHLVCSLRSKDVIATFNWDPFLWQAMARNSSWMPNALPITLFLHGNTAVGSCPQHRPIPVRTRGQLCPHCSEPLQDAKLLYPVGQKNYTSDPFIETNWKVLQNLLKNAYLLTVFGYSAPVTDVEAVGLMRTAWGDPYQRSQEQIEIIDIKEDAELHATWKPFIHSHHYQTTKSFFNSIAGTNPRRSCDALFSCLVDMAPVEPNPIPQECTWDEFQSFYGALVDAERNCTSS